MRRFVCRDVQDLLISSLKQAAVLETVEHLASAGARPVVFAGAVRDAFMTADGAWPNRPSRDVDVAVSNIARPAFDRVLKELGGTRNRYGGFRVVRSGLPSLDVWRMPDTCGLRKWGVPCNVRNVLRSFVINVNAIAFEVSTGLFEDWGCLAALRSRRLDIVEAALLHSHHTFAAKALVAQQRFSLGASPAMHKFIRRYLMSDPLIHEFAKIRDQWPRHPAVRSLSLGKGEGASGATREVSARDR